MFHFRKVFWNEKLAKLDKVRKFLIKVLYCKEFGTALHLFWCCWNLSRQLERVMGSGQSQLVRSKTSYGRVPPCERWDASSLRRPARSPRRCENWPRPPSRRRSLRTSFRQVRGWNKENYPYLCAAWKSFFTFSALNWETHSNILSSLGWSSN